MVTSHIGGLLFSLVNLGLARFSGEDGRALYVRLDLRMSNYDAYLDKSDGTIRFAPEEQKVSGIYRSDNDDVVSPVEAGGYLHFIFFRPDNYTTVFACHNYCHEIPKPDQWEFLTCHDTCWRESMNDKIFKVWMEMRNSISPADHKVIHPNFNCFSDVYRVTVETKDNDSDKFRYTKKVASLTEGWPDGSSYSTLWGDK